MAKKYLSLEEAASLLSMTTDQLMKVREQGDIRGFADRGSWKFREQDIDEFQRSRQADSSPDFIRLFRRRPCLRKAFDTSRSLWQLARTVYKT